MPAPPAVEREQSRRQQRLSGRETVTGVRLRRYDKGTSVSVDLATMGRFRVTKFDEDSWRDSPPYSRRYRFAG